MTSPADDGSQGTLRWALEKNNQNPGHYRIELQSTNTGAIVFNVPGLEHAAFIGNRGGGISNDTSKLEKICAIDGNVV